jgi:hypothetical protein
MQRRKSPKPRWVKQEEDIKKAFCGWGYGSGRSKSADKKSDVQTEEYMIEAKSTAKKSFTLSQGILTKITREAMAVNKLPLVVLEFDGPCAVTFSRKWVVVPHEHFLELIRENEK